MLACTNCRCVQSDWTKMTRPHFCISINGQQVNGIADSGAEINIIDESDYANMIPQPNFSQYNTNIFPYGSSTPIDIKGVFNADVKSATQHSNELFYVVAGCGGSLLGWKTSTRLQLVCVVQQISRDKMYTTPITINWHQSMTIYFKV